MYKICEVAHTLGQAEDIAPRSTDYYESTRALGELYRNIAIVEPPTTSSTVPLGAAHRPTPLTDPISLALKPYIEQQLHHFRNEDKDVSEMHSLFQRYVDELRYISVTHSLSDAPDACLMEEEIVVGTILAQCSQHRWRTDRTYRMRLHSSVLVRDIRNKLSACTEDEPTKGNLRFGLSQGWLAWDFGTRNKAIFGAKSFGLIALGVVFNMLEKLGGFELV